MKIDFDTLIYLIVTLVFVALGALGKKKPRVNVPDTDESANNDFQQDERTGDVFSENFRRLMGDYDEYNSQQSVMKNHDEIMQDREMQVEMVEHDIEERADSLDTIEDAVDKVEGAIDNAEEAMSEKVDYSHIEDEIKMSELGGMETMMEYHHDIDRLIENFDIRKAIIYSEILNPKYF